MHRAELVILAAFVCAVFADSQSIVSEQFSVERGPDAIVQAKSTAESPFVIFADPSHTFFPSFTSSKPQEMSVLDFSNSIKAVFALEPSRPDFSPSYLKVNLLKRPQAAVILAVEGVSLDIVRSHKLQHVQALIGDFPSFQLSHHSAQSLSFVASLMTGTHPSLHGIVGNRLKEEKNGHVSLVPSYSLSIPSSWPQQQSLADSFFESSHGASLLFSAASDPSLALAFSSHPSTLLKTFADHNHVLIQMANAAFENVPGLPLSSIAARFSLNHEGVLKLLAANPLGIPATDLEQLPPQLALELLIGHHVASLLQSNSMLSSMAHSEFPSLLSFAFSSLRSVSDEFGSESRQFIVALRLFDSALPLLLSHFRSVFGDRVIFALAFLGHHDRMATSSKLVQTMKQLNLAALNSKLSTEADLPVIFFSGSASSRHQQCLELRGHLRDLEVICAPSPPSLTSFSLLESSGSSHHLTILDSSNTSSNSSSTVVTRDNVIQYQIIMWTFISFTALVLVAVYSVGWMPTRQDALLYSKIGPQYSRKKTS